MSLSHKREAFSAHTAETLFTPRCINTMTLGMQKDARTCSDWLS